MKFKRKIYEKLIEWKRSESKNYAILIEGARRVGKSTVVRNFAEKEYKSFLIIDFTKVSPDVKELFENSLMDLDNLFSRLQIKFKVELFKGESLVVFDEVQNFPRAREAIKTLVEDGRYDYIETGSLISIKKNVENILIPSEEKTLKMFPLDFEEFCWATNNNFLFAAVKDAYENREPLDNSTHQQAMYLFKQYLLVGGMPQAVAAFIEGGMDFRAADHAKRLILDLYRSDIRKIDAPYQSKVTAIYDQIPSFLSKHEKRVILRALTPGQSHEKYYETFFWLTDSMICNECFNCTDPHAGLSMNEDRTFIKCYMGDTGLLVSHAFDEDGLLNNNIYEQIISGKLQINKGMLYENMIAQMLVANGHKLFYYVHYDRKKKHNDMEIDFMLSIGGKAEQKLIPVEVKSGLKYHTVSLNLFKDKYKNRISETIVLHPKNLEEKNGILYLPCYMACFL